MSEMDNHGSEFGGNEAQVRDLAYQLWDQDGRPEGQRDEYWYRAERQLAADAGEAPSEERRPDEPAPLAFIESTPVG